MSSAPSHLGHHDDVELVADLADQGREVVEAPGAVEGVDPRPQLGGLAEVGGPGDGDQPVARGDLVLGLDRVLEVAEQDIDGTDHRGDLGRHLGVAGIEEVDDPRRPGGDLADGGRGADGEGGEEVLGAAHASLPSSRDGGGGRREGAAPPCGRR